MREGFGKPTMGCVDHASRGGSVMAPSMNPADLREIVKVLRDIAEKIGSERTPAELKVPLPEFHNTVEVSPTPVEVQAPRVDNQIVVSPTPVEVHPHVTVDQAPPIVNVHLDVQKIVTAIYFLVGAFGAFAIGVLVALFRTYPS